MSSAMWRPKDRGPIWTYEAMLKQKNRLKSFGLNLSVFEGICE
jgi:D-mannonate dehydratase